VSFQERWCTSLLLSQRSSRAFGLVDLGKIWVLHQDGPKRAERIEVLGFCRAQGLGLGPRLESLILLVICKYGNGGLLVL